LDLTGTKSEVKALLRFSDALKENATLKEMNVEYNTIQTEGKAALRKVQEVNKGVKMKFCR